MRRVRVPMDPIGYKYKLVADTMANCLFFWKSLGRAYMMDLETFHKKFF